MLEPRVEFKWTKIEGFYHPCSGGSTQSPAATRLGSPPIAAGSKLRVLHTGSILGSPRLNLLDERSHQFGGGHAANSFQALTCPQREVSGITALRGRCPHALGQGVLQWKRQNARATAFNLPDEMVGKTPSGPPGESTGDDGRIFRGFKQGLLVGLGRPGFRAGQESRAEAEQRRPRTLRPRRYHGHPSVLPRR